MLTDEGIGFGGEDEFRVRKSADGKSYYWRHDTNLYRDPSFLFLLCKIFFFIWLGLALFLLILDAFRGSLVEALWLLRPMFFVLIFLMCLVTFSYYVYTLIMGGKYSVLFVMDSKGINHIQLPSQYKKAQKIASIAMVAGLATGNLSTAGAGMLASGKQGMYTAFKKVNSVKVYKKKHTIKLRFEGLAHNQVYTAPEDFDFVLDFIQQRTLHLTKN
ncbi:MAG TPA: hypothetical protein PKW24_08555 [Clostridiales bacterium]|jgi:hypothetical protein|nr:hypothetical protein [Clostridiales bacterium]HRT81804.1 hypothetical protein [Oscillospiraceae bacterium]